MYKGDYDKETIFLTKELDRKRIENEKCEAILYQADYECSNSKDIQETRVVKFIPDDGEIYHGILCGIEADENAPNKLDSISNPLSTAQFFASNTFWCAETEVPEELDQTPVKIWLINLDEQGNYDLNNQVMLNKDALKQWAEKYVDKKELEISFLANVNEADIENVKQGFQNSGSIIISDNFPELNVVGYFEIKSLNNFSDKKEIEVSFYAEAKESDVEKVIRGFQKSGADVIAENFPELRDIGYFKISEVTRGFQEVDSNDLFVEYRFVDEKKILAEEPERMKQVEKKDFVSRFKALCEEYNVSPKQAIKAMVNKMVDEKNRQNGSQR